MKTKREVLASLLTGNSEPLQQYQREREACFILLIEGTKEAGYCIYPDLTVKEVEADSIRAKMEMNNAGFKISFSECKKTFAEFEADLLANPSKYYKAKGLIQMVFFSKD
ncbi:hypothetical protein [Runella zeae]|uniref:hypothetical protein n=1 Tax=Runella zeae TaxID=94255 RepID=UPI002352F132|nr:hypothetical protein [Runella zeae]